MGEGCIVRRGKRSWRLKFEKGTDDDGKRLIGYETVRGSKKDAKIRLTEILESRNKGSFVDRTAMTVGDYLGRWLADHAAHAVSRKTYERYSEIVEKHLVPALGAKNLSDLKPLAIQAYYSQALTEGRRDGNGGVSGATGRSYIITGCSARPYGRLYGGGSWPSIRPKLRNRQGRAMPRSTS